MEKLTSALKTLGTGDTTDKEMDPSKDTASALDSSSTAPQPSLENLPVELQGLILSKVPALQSLSALVHASPELHRVYSGERLPILRSVLENTLKGMHVDALGVHQSGTDVFQGARETSLLWAFVEEHKAKYATTESDWTAQLSFEDIIELLHFHVLVIEPLTERYASWALASLPTSSDEEQAGHIQQPLSDTERSRIQRAMYRLQLLCNICGSRGEGNSAPDRIDNSIDRLRVLSMFPPWEIEQILCIHEFAKDVYTDVFGRVAWDLNMNENPKYRHESNRDTIEDLLLIEDSDGGYVNERSLNAVLRHGLHLLLDTINTEDHEQLVDRIRASILSGMEGEHRGYEGDDWLDDAVTDILQEERREQWYSEHDSAQDFRHKIPFNGDSLDSPPLSWVLYWRGEYSNFIGPSYINAELRRWGYAMWDASRLGSRARDRIDYFSFRVCGRGEDEDPRGETYDDSVRGERSEDWLYE